LSYLGFETILLAITELIKSLPLFQEKWLPTEGVAFSFLIDPSVFLRILKFCSEVKTSRSKLAILEIPLHFKS
jgi:hypothetical protein